MNNALKMAAGTLVLLSALAANATENMYTVISGGFADSDFADSSVDGASYKFALGHQFHPQWYVEGGVQRIADETVNDFGSTDALEGDAFFISVLGKAGSREGELYYRLGLLRADMKGYRNAESCVETPCSDLERYDDSVIAGVVGIGFDYYISLNSMIRLEVEHISGEDNLQVNAAYLGFRYNFN